MRTLTASLIASLGMLLFACVAAEAGDGSAKTIYVLSNGWHTGIGLQSRHLRGTALAEIATQFPRADYLVFGWGEAGYYRAPKITPWITLKGIFFVNPAVLHVIGVHGKIERFFHHSEILAVPVSRSGFENLTRFLSAEFLRNRRDDRVCRLGSGCYPASGFYAARGKYYLPKTCNVWTAGVIRSARIRVNPTFALAADDLMWRVRPHGKRIQTLKRPVDAF